MKLAIKTKKLFISVLLILILVVAYLVGQFGISLRTDRGQIEKEHNYTDLSDVDCLLWGGAE